MEMSSIWKVSDTEVSSAIRYLDPDFFDDRKIHHGAEARSRRWIKGSLVILSIVAILYMTAHRFWPVVLRLLS
jgi:hypothetical protein